MNLDRFTACSIPFIGQPLDQALNSLLATGWTRIDLLGRMPHFSPDPEEQDFGEAQKAIKASGAVIANLGTYLGRNFHSDQAAMIDRDMELGLRCIELAAELGARTARVLPGQGEDPAQIDRIAPHFSRLAKAAEQVGVYLVMENHAGSIAGNPDLAVRLCEAVGSEHFGVLYEPCNLLHGRTDYWSAYGAMRRWVRHVHLKDGKWFEDKFQGTHLGDGEVRIAELVALLDSDGYEGDYAVEYEVANLDPPESGLRRWHDWLADL